MPVWISVGATLTILGAISRTDLSGEWRTVIHAKPWPDKLPPIWGMGVPFFLGLISLFTLWSRRGRPSGLLLTIPVATALFSYVVASLCSRGGESLLALLGILLGASLIVSGNHATRLYPDRKLPRVLSGIGGLLLVVPFLLKDADRWKQARLLSALGSASFDGRQWGAVLFAWILLGLGMLGLLSPFGPPSSKLRSRAISVIGTILLVAFPFALGQTWWEREQGAAVLDTEGRDLLLKFWLLGSGHTILLSTAVAVWTEEVLSRPVENPVPTRDLSKWAGAVVLAILLVGLFIFMLPEFETARRQSRQRNASACLVTLAVAEQDYRTSDRDGNGLFDFWTGDVAGLLKFGKIPKELAEADAAPLNPLVPKPVPYQGYLFRALVLDRSEAPPEAYGQDTDKVSGKVHHLTKFAFIAFPADTSEGKYFYIVNENNTMFPSAYTDKIPFDWPTDDDLKKYYMKVQ